MESIMGGLHPEEWEISYRRRNHDEEDHQMLRLFWDKTQKKQGDLKVKGYLVTNLAIS